MGDFYDPDDDNDGINDVDDMFPFDASEWKDSDRDGIGDNADLDDDNDMIPDDEDDFPLDSGRNSDFDNDGIDDRLDFDDDGDGVVDAFDAFPLNPTEWEDTDGDGIGNNRDNDDDGDGFIDLIDRNPNESGTSESVPPSQYSEPASGTVSLGGLPLIFILLFSSAITFGYGIVRSRTKSHLENTKMEAINDES